jgi:hypothetical protein
MGVMIWSMKWNGKEEGREEVNHRVEEGVGEVRGVWGDESVGGMEYK